MALDLTTLFTRLGHHAGGLNEENTAVGATLTTRANTVFADYTSSDQELTDNIYANRDVARASFDQMKQYWQGLSQATLREMILDGTVYNPQSVLEDVQVLRLEMLAQSATIDDVTIAGTLTAGSGNVGNGSGEISWFNVYGSANEYILAETIVLTCATDGYPGGSATQGQETFSFQGDLQYPNLAWNWPAGSAATGTITVCDPAVDDILSNASFDDWTAPTSAPTDWTVQIGTLGTTIVRSATTYRGTYALTFVGNGSELTEIRQAVTIAPNTTYSAQIQMRSDGSVAAGVVQIRLINADTGAVITDESSNALAIQVLCNTLTSSYAPQKATFFTPSVLPTNVAMQIKATTAITSTEVIYMDDLGFALADQFYTGGPYIKLFAGSTPYAVGDAFAAAFTNARTATTFVSYLDNIFDLRTLGVTIPSSGAPTISNALIT